MTYLIESQDTYLAYQGVYKVTYCGKWFSARMDQGRINPMSTLAWITILVSSTLPNLLLQSYFGTSTLAIPLLKGIVIAGIVTMTFLRPQWRPLTGFALVALAWAMG